MPLPNPGVALSASMINDELTRASTALFSMNGADERTLADRPTANSTISFNDFYGKSFFTDGGYYPQNSNNLYSFMNFLSEAFSSISISGFWLEGANFGASNKSAGYVLEANFSPIRFSKIAFVTNTPSQITTVSIDATFHAGVYADSSKGYFSRGSSNISIPQDTHRDGYRVNLSNETLTFLGNLFPSNVHGACSFSNLGNSGYFGRRAAGGTLTTFFFKLTYSNETTSSVTTPSTPRNNPVGWSNSPTAGYLHVRAGSTRVYRKLTYSNDSTTTLTAPSSAPGTTAFAFSYLGVNGYLSGASTTLNKLAYSNDTWSTITRPSQVGTQGFSTFL